VYGLPARAMAMFANAQHFQAQAERIIIHLHQLKESNHDERVNGCIQ
jgi:hypothetical protein